MEESKEFDLYSILDSIPASIYWKDKNGYYLGCNKYMLKMANASFRSEIIGKKDEELPWKEFASRLKEIDQNVINNNISIEIEETPTLANRQQRVFTTSKSPLLEKNGNIIGIIGASIDITTQKEAEFREKEALVQIVAEQKEVENLREKVKTMQVLGGTIAHEIRNPLLAIGSAQDVLTNFLPILIKAYHQVIKTDESFDFIRPDILEEIPNMLQIIKNEIDASNLFIDTLLSKIKEKPETKDFEECAISECIRMAIERYPFGSQEKMDKVHWLNNDDFIFHGNKTMIVHVLFNLLKNALHYIGVADKGEITLWVEKDAQGHYLHFKDTGTGISEEVLPQLFTRFFSQTRYGTGLVLAFCKNVMESLGGDIQCQSVAGEYTEFILSFPLR